MENNISAKLLLNLVQEKHDIYKSNLANLLSVLSDNDQGMKIEANQKLLNTSNDLADILASTDRPHWLNETLSFTGDYQNQNKTPDSIVSGSSWRLLQRAMRIYNQAMEHNWDFTGQVDNKEYDFDEIYQNYRDKSDLISLFNSLIETLNKMVDSDEIDSIKAVSALNDLIAMLTQNKDSSYFSTMASWEFVKAFTKNYVWEQISSLPGVRSLKKAFETTVSDMDMEMEKLHKDISNELRKKCQLTMHAALTYKSIEGSLLGNKNHSSKQVTNNGKEK